MSTRNQQIRFNLYLNDKSAGKTMATMQKDARKLRAQIRKLEVGSKEWLQQTKKLNGMNADMKLVNSKMRAQEGLLSRLATGFNKYSMMGAAAVATLAAFVMGFRKLSDVIVEFEKRMTNVYTLLSPEQIDLYGASIENTALIMIKRGHEIETVTKSMFDAISAGVDAGKTEEFMNQAERLAVGGVTELATATDGLTSVLNAYHLSVDESATVSEAFFSAQKAGKTTVEELANNIGQIAPIASNLDITYQELLATMSALTKNGIDTASATTYLKGAMTSLIKPTNEASRLFEKEFNHSLGATAVKTIGFSKVLEELSILMEKYPDEMAKAIPNVRGLTAVTALSGEGFQVYSDILKQVQEDIGETSSLSNAYAMQQETTEMAIRRAKGELTATTIALKDELKPAILAVMKVAKQFSHLMLKAVGFYKDHKEAIQKVAKAILIATGVMLVYNLSIKVGKGLVMAYTYASSVFSTIVGVLTGKIKLATLAQKAWNFVTSLNPLGAIGTAIVLLIAAIVKYWDWIKKITTATWDMVDNSTALKVIFFQLWAPIKLLIGGFKLLRRAITGVTEAQREAARQAEILIKKNIEDYKKRGTAYKEAFRLFDAETARQLQNMQEQGATDEEYHNAKIKRLQMRAKVAEQLRGFDHGQRQATATQIAAEEEAWTNRAIKNEKEKQAELKKLRAETSKERIKELKKLNADLDKVDNKLLLDKHTKAEQELILLDQKYAKFRATAKGNNEALKRIDALYYKERAIIERKQDEKLQKDKLKLRKSLKLTSDAELLNIELANLKTSFDNNLLSEAEYLQARENMIDEWEAKEAQKISDRHEAQHQARLLYNLVSDQELREEELLRAEEARADDLLTEEDYLKAVDSINKYYRDKELEDDAKAAQKKRDILANSIIKQTAVVNAWGSFINAQMEAELYAAGTNEERKKQIRKEYADTQMAITIAQIISDTALAVINAYAQLGPIAGGIAAAGIIGVGGVQTQMAVNQRNRIKGYKDGGRVNVTSDADGKNYNAVYGGIAPGGVIKEPTLYMTGEGGIDEYLIPGWLRSDPVVADFERIIENKRVRGFKDGGDTAESSNSDNSSNINERLLLFMEENLSLLSNLANNGVDGVWQWDRFKTGFDEMTTIESNNLLS